MQQCSLLGPFARFMQVIALYADVNLYNTEVATSRDEVEKSRSLQMIDDQIRKFLSGFPEHWSSSHLEGEHLIEPTTLALAHWLATFQLFFFANSSAYLLLYHPIGYLQPSHERTTHARSRCAAAADTILDIAHVTRDRPKVNNYLLPHPLILAARVRLQDITELRGNYRGRDMDLVVSAMRSIGRNWGLHGMKFSLWTLLKSRKNGRTCRRNTK